MEACSFSVFQALTPSIWGSAGDCYGRRYVELYSARFIYHFQSHHAELFTIVTIDQRLFSYFSSICYHVWEQHYVQHQHIGC